MNLELGSKSFNQTMTEVLKYKIQTVEEETELWLEYEKTGDERIPERVFLSSLWYIGWLVNRDYGGRGVDLCDLFSAGVDEIRRGMPYFIKFKMYKPDEGRPPIRLVPYCMPAVRERIARTLARLGNQIRVPKHLSSTAKKFFESFDRDRKDEATEETLLRDQVPDDFATDAALESEKITFRLQVAARLDKARHGEILRDFYGIDREFHKTATEIARDRPDAKWRTSHLLDGSLPESFFQQLLHPEKCVTLRDYEKSY